MNIIKVNKTGESMNGKDARQEFFEQQLFEAKNALFSATSVREIKFLQNKIKYLEHRMSHRLMKEGLDE